MDSLPSIVPDLAKPRRRWLRPLLWIGGGLVLGVVATLGTAYATRSWWAHSWPGSHVPYADIVEIYKGKGYGEPVLKLADGVTGRVFRSMLVADPSRRVDLRGVNDSAYVIRYGRGPGSYSGPAPGIEFRRVGNDYVWLDGNTAYRTYGDLTAFLEAMPAVRCVQLLHSDRVDGQRLKEARYDSFCDSLFALCTSENPKVQSLAFDSLAKFIAERRPTHVRGAWLTERKWNRADQAPRAADVRRVALDAVERAMQTVTTVREAMQVEQLAGALACLNQTGDASTIDALMQMIELDVESSRTAVLMDCVEFIAGLPPSYDRVLMCGNSSKEEFRKAREVETARRQAGREKLLAWHRAQANQPDEVRYDATLDVWAEYVPAHRREWSRSNDFPRWSKVDRLLSLGTAVVPALERRRSRSTALVEEGFLEIARACLTGQSDENLVKRLFAGDVAEQTAACRIAAATGETTWRRQLTASLRHPTVLPLHRFDPYEVDSLRDAAAEALLTCYGPGALPELRAAADLCFTARYAVEHYSAPGRP